MQKSTRDLGGSYMRDSQTKSLPSSTLQISCSLSVWQGGGIDWGGRNYTQTRLQHGPRPL